MSKKRKIENIELYDIYENKLKNSKLNGTALIIKATTQNAEGEILFAGAYIKDIPGNYKLMTKLATAKVASNGKATLRLDIPFSYLSYSFSTGTDPSTEYFAPKVVVSFVPRLEAWVENNKLYVGYENGKQLSYEINAHGMVELPADDPFATNGQFTFDGIVLYRYYNRNDEKVNGKTEYDNWGTADMVAKFINIAIEYKRSYENGVLEFGDLSTETGGSPRFWDSNRKTYRPHASHFKGSQIDLRYMYDNGNSIIGLGNGAVAKASVSRIQLIIDIANKYGINLIGLGTALNGKVSGEGKIFFNSEHNNHIHIGIK